MIPLYSIRSLAVRHAASTDETRYHLNGVRFEADGTTTATDGHVLMRADEGERPDPSEFPAIAGRSTKGELEPFTLPRDSAEALAKHLRAARKAARGLPILAYAALDREEANKSSHAEFKLTDLETTQNVTGRKVEGEYVNWQQIIQAPDQQPRTSVTLDTRLIAKVLKAAAEFNPDSRYNGIRIEVFGQESTGDRADYFGPVRFTVDNPDGGKLQAWVTPIQER